MAHLSISLLGSFRVMLDNQPVTSLGTAKAQALLAYLVMEANHPHLRDSLAGLLWANSPHTRARQSLRQALSHLRQALCDQQQAVPFLRTGRERVQFNTESDYWLDVARFTALDEACRKHHHRQLAECGPCLRRLQQMVDLYGGDLMDGFFLRDSYAFEEWAALQREYLQRRVVEALAHLAGHHERRGDTKLAIEITRQKVHYQPWREEAHRELMHYLALDGQRSAALVQYQICRRALALELGVGPTAETTTLYEQIRDQSFMNTGTARGEDLAAQAHGQGQGG